MGLGNRNNSTTIYCRAAEGKIVITSNSADTKAVRRMNKVGKEVFERLYDDLSGKLTGIYLKEGEYNGTKTKDWNFVIVDNGQKFILTLRYDSNYAKKLINALANVEDFTKTLCFSAWKMDETKSPTKKPMTGMSLYRGNQPNKSTRVLSKFEREQLPELKEIHIKGEVKYDDTELCAFLHRVVETEIVPRVQAAKADNDLENLGAEDELPSELGVGEAATATADEDGLPF